MPPFGAALTPELIQSMTVARHWRNETLVACLDRWARRYPDKVAMVDGAGRYTYDALLRTVERVAHGLHAHGLGRGSVVSVQLPNWNEFALVGLAAASVGAVLNPIPPVYRANELRFILGLLEAQCLVIPGTFRGFDHAAMIGALRPELPALERVFVARGAPGPGMLPLSALTDTAWEGRPGRTALAASDPNEVHEVIFTSGTTGEPKGVMHTQNTALALVYPAIERLDFSEREVILMASTFGHQIGYLYGLCLSMVLGATGVWLDGWEAGAAAQLIERERVSCTMGATPFLRDLAYAPVTGRHDLSSLRVFVCGGAPIPRQLVRDARQRLGCAISPAWGMTENGLVTCTARSDPEEKVASTDGRPLPSAELRLVDSADRPVAPGTEGHLVVRAPSQSVGYFKRPHFTAEAYTADGWFRTGDRAVLDEAGYLSITGRAKDLIIRGGQNVSAVEVENLLFAHPKVAAVAVVGMPDARLGERVCAFVAPREGEPPTLGEIRAYLEERQVARYKFPERLEVVAEFPVTPSGKVQKHRLRDLVAAKLAEEGASRPG